MNTDKAKLKMRKTKFNSLFHRCKSVPHRWLILLLTTASPVLAVGTSRWVHTTEADFKAGTFHNVVATNLGDLKLSRSVKTILEQDPRISSVYAMVQAKDGTIYAATGPQGVLLAIKDDKASDAA